MSHALTMWTEDAGQDLIEHALLVALLAISVSGPEFARQPDCEHA